MAYDTYCQHCERNHPNQEFLAGLCPGCESIGHTTGLCLACDTKPRAKKTPRRQTASSVVRAANTCAAVAPDEIAKSASAQLTDALRVLEVLRRSITEELLSRLPK